MSNSQYQTDLSELTLRKLDGSITDEQRLELFRRLESDPKAIDSYVELTLLYSCLSEPSGRWDVSGEPTVISGDEYSVALKAMAEYEHQALPQEIEPVVKSKPEIAVSIHKPVKTETRRMSKVSLFTAVVSLAALLLMIIYVNFFPVPTRETVAVLMDSVDAKWARSDLPAEIDSNLSNGDGIRNLLRGCVKVQFFGGAEVIIEGPAEFELKSFESMDLNSGRLYATVPSHAIGFTVNTPCSQIVDLGTEFGVKVDFDGTSDLHMFKGRASISAGVDGRGESAREVIQDQALRVKPSRNLIQEIPVEKQMFIRHISSDNRLLWRGESLDLAKLASGGDGILNWGNASAIDPRTGRQTLRIHEDRQASNAYVPVAWNPYIDGIFVPNGDQPQIVTSQLHQFKECPSTNSVFCEDLIVNQASMDSRTTMVLRGVHYGIPDHPGFFMHANLGITFDLEKIRLLVQEGAGLVFRSEIGISEEGSDKECNADFWVLVDGEVRYQKLNVQTKGPCDKIILKLNEGDRFLTLITTDGGSPPDTPDIRQTDSDWCLFAEPIIEVE